MNSTCGAKCIIFLKTLQGIWFFWSCHKFYISFLWFIFHATFICILSIPHFALTKFLALFTMFHKEGSWEGLFSKCVHSRSKGTLPILMLQLFFVFWFFVCCFFGKFHYTSYVFLLHCFSMTCFCHISHDGQWWSQTFRMLNACI